MLKRIILLLLQGLIFICVDAQKKEELFFVYKEDWNPAKDFDDAFYFMHQLKENDSTYVCRTYQKKGPMINWETYLDKDLKTPNGRFAWYNKNGQLDSLGDVYKGRKNDKWHYYNAAGKVILTEEYDKGKLVTKWDYTNRKIIKADGSVEPMDKPKEISKDTTKEKVFSVVQKPAEFKGGINGWVQYLQKNMKTPDRFLNLYKKKAYTGTVVVLFEINKEGIVDNISIEKSCEWSTDMEAIRVLKASPKWQPAVQNERNVIYRHKQSLTFQVTEE